jgi:hypothetical protein
MFNSTPQLNCCLLCCTACCCSLLSPQKQPPNVNEVRFQVVRLMRMLVQVCQTLDQVPDEVSCKQGL